MLNSLITACEKAGEWSWALHCFTWLASLAILPSVVTYSAAVSACGAAQQWHCAVMLMSTALAQHLQVDVAQQ